MHAKVTLFLLTNISNLFTSNKTNLYNIITMWSVKSWQLTCVNDFDNFNRFYRL